MATILSVISISLLLIATGLAFRFSQASISQKARLFIVLGLLLLTALQGIILVPNIDIHLPVQPGLISGLILSTVSLLLVSGVFIISRQVQQLQTSNKALLYKKQSLDHSNEAIIWMNATGQFLDANVRACELLGYTREELLDLDIADIQDNLPTAEFSDHWQEWHSVGSATISADLKTKANIFVPVEISLSFLSYGSQDSACAFIRDISESKLAKEELKSANTKLNTILESEPECVKTVARDGTLLSMNPAGLGLIEAPTFDEVDGALVYDLIAPEHRDQFIELNKKVFDGQSIIMEYEIIGLQGGRKWVETHATPLRDKSGDIIAHLAVTRDITERKMADESLKKLSRAVESTSTTVIITDCNGTIEYVNPKFTEITGYHSDEAIGKNVNILRSAQTPSDTYQELWQTITAGDVWQGTVLNRKRDGDTYWSRVSISSIENNQGEITHYISTQEDITKEHLLSNKLNHQARHDALTGILNRSEFEHRANRLITKVRTEKSVHALCFMDLDQFKIVNDTGGHIAGDELLRQVAMILREQVRQRDTLARLGGDEFAILMEYCNLEQAQRITTLLHDAIQNYQFSWEGHTFKIGVSIGLVAINETTPNFTELLRQADAACYAAKDLGRNRIHLYEEDDVTVTAREGEIRWVPRIHKALEENRFCLFAQTIKPLKNSTDIHYELLVRMIDESGNLVAPGLFLPAAERYDLAENIDHWVISNAFRTIAANPSCATRIKFLSINISGQSIAAPNFLDFIVAALKEHNIDGKMICFEITETAAISKLSMAVQFIKTLKQFGCQFALDDFGSGLSSFGYLKNLPVDYLKIDGMFVKDIAEDPVYHAMIKSINEIGQTMGMQTIAEYVENDEIMSMLQHIGVNFAQGYGIDKPQPFSEILARLKQSNPPLVTPSIKTIPTTAEAP
ncbi:EAL domain-containing protein [Pontibacter sp. JAM-7]|uniref:EAL domain-containing protein n=1 Tax=Pontibacter sp. JAM-7 TaxID=3366581 RepID=UPI003AF5D088